LEHFEKFKDFYLCVRVAHGQNDPLLKEKVDPNTKNEYIIPEIHSFAAVNPIDKQYMDSNLIKLQNGQLEPEDMALQKQP